MSDIMEFSNREEFRKWLYEHCLSNEGVWLLFGKAGGPKTIKAGEALEEALCGYRGTNTRAYFDAKTDAGQEKRIAWVVDRHNKNLKPIGTSAD